MSTNIILVRHGETDWNNKKIFRGRVDIPLNKRGLEQAELTGKALRPISFSAIYTSPSRRTRQTAECIARHQRKYLAVTDAISLIDPDFGLWHGLSVDEVAQRFPREYDLWLNHPQKIIFPEGESLENVRIRAWNFIRELLLLHEHETIGLVSHRVIIRLVLLSMLGLDSSKYWSLQQDNCALNGISYRKDRGFLIRFVNEACHLQPRAAGH